MTPNTTQPTAKIYQFPIGGRAALNSNREPVRPAVEYAPAGSGWYHDAAIEEANRGTEH